MYRIIGADGKEYGPASAEQLRQWTAEGRVNNQTRVQAEGGTEWKALADFPELTPATVPSPPPPAPAATTVRPHVPNYLASSILVTLFCCLPFGIVAIVHAAQVNTKLAAGDVPGAELASRRARQWCWASVAGWFLAILAYLAFFGIAALSVGRHQYR
jgi:hypothetical protein